MNTPDAKDTRIRTPTNGPKRDRSTVSAAHASWKSRGKRDFHTAFASALKRHRCEKPLRVASPPTGWVTALAGLLARGSSPASGLPGFPVAMNGRRFAAYSCGGSHGFGPKWAVPRSLLPLRTNRRTSAAGMIPFCSRASQDHGVVRRWHAKDTKNLYVYASEDPALDDRAIIDAMCFELFSRSRDQTD